eukprot:jgi/Mesen1/5762/ME000292S04833
MQRHLAALHFADTAFTSVTLIGLGNFLSYPARVPSTNNVMPRFCCLVSRAGNRERNGNNPGIGSSPSLSRHPQMHRPASGVSRCTRRWKTTKCRPLSTPRAHDDCTPGVRSGEKDVSLHECDVPVRNSAQESQAEPWSPARHAAIAALSLALSVGLFADLAGPAFSLSPHAQAPNVAALDLGSSRLIVNPLISQSTDGRGTTPREPQGMDKWRLLELPLPPFSFPSLDAWVPWSGPGEQVIPSKGLCATCIGVVDDTLGSCGKTLNCISSFDDRSDYFVGPWEYQGTLGEAMDALAAEIKRGDGTLVERDELYVYATFETDRGGIDDVEFLFSRPETDSTVVLRASSRAVERPDWGRNAKRLESLRAALSWEQIPILRNRQRRLGIIESPWDSFGPEAPPTYDYNDQLEFSNAD